ncbi:MAG: sugar ABC transporter ATP-binding protein [Anaerolineae bacterium]|nr:sugar ABC transporter ATP-binding protein [Anaerolineae bacterium]MDW8172698.1 sugar ABC transporter ATP-binding protein [Anaerolineae bacterium]
MSVVLHTNKLSKAFFGVPAVQDVSISVEAGQILGLVGQNGAGKSTLMNLIGGVVHADSGTMSLHGQPYQPRNPADAFRAGIAFIHQELNLFTNLSIAENIFIESFPTQRRGPFRLIDRSAVHQRTEALLAQVGLALPPNLTIDRISPGERQLVEIAKALHIDASLFILDEPTTSLTNRETERLFALMKQLQAQGKALIYISHILNDVLALADSIAVMRDGQLITQEPVQNFDVGRMISLMVGRSIDHLYPERTSQPSSEILLDVQGVTADGIVKDIALRVHQGEIVGLFGLMGSGRTELARILFGVDGFESGQVILDKRRFTVSVPRESIRSGVAFVTENRREEGLLMDISIHENVALVALPQFCHTPLQIVDQDAAYSSVRQTLNALQLKSGDIRKQPVRSLSGGNQQKVVIAKWLLSKPKLFIMDEPTRGIDVEAKFEIYTIMDQLAGSGSGILFISSELEELMGMCDRIVVMSRGEIVGEFARQAFDAKAILHAAFREGEALT